MPTSVEFIYFKEEIDALAPGEITLGDKVSAIMAALTSGILTPYPFDWFLQNSADYNVTKVYTTFIAMIRKAKA